MVGPPLVAAVLALTLSADAHVTGPVRSSTPSVGVPSPDPRGDRVLATLAREACRRGAARAERRNVLGRPFGSSVDTRPLVRSVVDAACAWSAPGAADNGHASVGLDVSRVTTTLPDGSLIAIQQVAAVGGVGFNLVAYASQGLVIGGILCYPTDGRRHSAVIHIHGGFGGLFVNSDGDMIQTCIDWAQLYGRTAFAPSLRGQDGSDGQFEMCLGEANDVAAGAVMLSSLSVVNSTRVALIGGSLGACVVLKAAPMIPNLRAVVAFVPPTDWKSLVHYHRTSWAPATETECDGSTRQWTIGGPSSADTLDDIICGHPGCSDLEYQSRSPIPGVTLQSAPTLVVSATLDNLVPVDQQVLWSFMRQQTGRPVALYVMGPCDPAQSLPPGMDLHLAIVNGFHLLSEGAVGTGYLFLMQQLDAAA